jgi:hypothetical protein
MDSILQKLLLFITNTAATFTRFYSYATILQLSLLILQFASMTQFFFLLIVMPVLNGDDLNFKEADIILKPAN